MIRNGADWDGEAPCMPDPDVEAWADAPWGEQAPEPELAAADVALQLSRGRSHHKVIDCQELMWIAHWADLHPGPEQAPTVPGAERAITIGGDGTPEIAEFCTAELAAALGVSAGIGRSMTADVLDLRHRLPRLWARVQDCEVEARTVCRIAAMTRVLSKPAADRVDASVVDLVGTLPWRRLESIVWAKIIEADPELAAKIAQSRQRRKKVKVGESSPEGLTPVWACMETADAVWLDAMIDHLATRLEAFGAPGTRDELRAQALGVLARPAEAVQLLAAPLPGYVPPSPTDNPQPGTDSQPSGDGQPGGPHGDGESGVTGWGERARLLPESGIGWPVNKWFQERGRHQTDTTNNDGPDGAGPDGAEPHQSGPGSTGPAGPPPANTGPTASGANGPETTESDPAEADPTEAEPTETEPTETEPTETEPTEPDPAGFEAPNHEPEDEPEFEEPEDTTNNDCAQRGPLPASAAALVEALRQIPAEKLRPHTVLNVHISLEALTQRAGVCRVDGIGAHTLDTVKNWLGRTTVHLNPVIDLPAGHTPVDAYEIPQRLRQHLNLRMPTSTFPWSPSRAQLDLDHTDPYQPDGPPGQTRIGNLAPLGRFEHRLVTHGHWSRRQPEPGTLLFRAPHGQILLVDPNGTHALADTPYTQHLWETAAPSTSTEADGPVGA